MITAKEMVELADSTPYLGAGFELVLKEIQHAASMGRYYTIYPFHIGISSITKLREAGFGVSEDFKRTYIDWLD